MITNAIKLTVTGHKSAIVVAEGDLGALVGLGQADVGHVLQIRTNGELISVSISVLYCPRAGKKIRILELRCLCLYTLSFCCPFFSSRGVLRV